MPHEPVPPVALSPKTPKRRLRVRDSIYLLPNMMTVLSLFFGLASMRLSFEGRHLGMPSHFLLSAQAILAAAVCDALDGSIARLTRTQSAFGMHLDSLCDLVSFGVAPAWLAYNFALQGTGKFGFAAMFLFVACGALRLARFNVQASLGNQASKNFSGIPIPMAAAPIAIFVLALDDLTTWTLEGGYYPLAVEVAQFLTSPKFKTAFFLTGLMLLAFGMISTFEYVGTKSLKLPKKRPLRVFVLLVFVMVWVLSFEFYVSLAALFVVYCLHGPLLWLILKRDKSQEEEDLFTAGDSETDEGAREEKEYP